MRLEHLTDVWAASHKTATEYGAEVGGYTGLRKLSLNIQTDHSELDIQEYGETVNEIVHLRSLTPPTLGKGDMVYLREPQPIGTFEIDGVAYEDYGEGDYKVIGVRSAYMAGVRNPTVIDARIVTK